MIYKTCICGRTKLTRKVNAPLLSMPILKRPAVTSIFFVGAWLAAPFMANTYIMAAAVGIGLLFVTVETLWSRKKKGHTFYCSARYSLLTEQTFFGVTI